MHSAPSSTLQRSHQIQTCPGSLLANPQEEQALQQSWTPHCAQHKTGRVCGSRKQFWKQLSKFNSFILKNHWNSGWTDSFQNLCGARACFIELAWSECHFHTSHSREGALPYHFGEAWWPPQWQRPGKLCFWWSGCFCPWMSQTATPGSLPWYRKSKRVQNSALHSSPWHGCWWKSPWGNSRKCYEMVKLRFKIDTISDSIFQPVTRSPRSRSMSAHRSSWLKSLRMWCAEVFLSFCSSSSSTWPSSPCQGFC